MGFKKGFLYFFASLILFLSRCIRLIFFPYQTMRSISEDEDIIQLFFIFIGIGAYFYIADKFRQSEFHPIALFVITIINFLLTALFFILFKKFSKSPIKVKIKSGLLLFGYSLIPTLIWFLINLFLFLLLPPPRSISILGKGFSILYMCISVSILFWKVLIEYLAIRFLTGWNFFRIIYAILLYLICAIPYSYFLYNLRLFRIPFL